MSVKKRLAYEPLKIKKKIKMLFVSCQKKATHREKGKGGGSVGRLCSSSCPKKEARNIILN